MSIRRGNQEEYNRLLDAFNAKSKAKKESIDYLVSLGYLHEQADNAVHVYWKGGSSSANFRLTREQRSKILDDFNAQQKTPRECVDYLRSRGCSYRQSTSAVYKYRQEKGLIVK